MGRGIAGLPTVLVGSFFENLLRLERGNYVNKKPSPSDGNTEERVLKCDRVARVLLQNCDRPRGLVEVKFERSSPKRP